MGRDTTNECDGRDAANADDNLSDANSQDEDETLEERRGYFFFAWHPEVEREPIANVEDQFIWKTLSATFTDAPLPETQIAKKGPL